MVAVKEDDNQLLHLSPVPFPHTLIAGMTGSGQSVLLQNIILGVAATNAPDQATIAIIDPKCSAQLKHFEKLPHMNCPIVNEQQPSLDLLALLCAEMDERNKRLAEADASDITKSSRPAIATCLECGSSTMNMETGLGLHKGRCDQTQ